MGVTVTLRPVPPTSHFVESNGLRLHYLRWGDPAEHGSKPPVFLLHATGFLAWSWLAVAEALCDRFTVYALDRRGHGLSEQPAGGYDLVDFADDLIGVVDALDVRGAYGIGHSAGGTDLLYMAAERPQAVTRLSCIEPIIMDPTLERPAGGNFMAETARRRRGEFASRQAAYERYASRPPFSVWQPAVLQAYVDHGFEQLSDGSVRLRCPPAIEAKMYGGTRVRNLIPLLKQLRCPVLLITGGNSMPHYGPMAETAAAAIPDCARHHFTEATHFIPQQIPKELVARLVAFADGA